VQVPFKYWQISTKAHGAISEETIVFMGKLMIREKTGHPIRNKSALTDSRSLNVITNTQDTQTQRDGYERKLELNLICGKQNKQGSLVVQLKFS
jgi:hypothetical protein